MYPSDKCVFAGRSPSATRWHGSRCDPRESRQQYDSADVHFLPSFFLALALALFSFFPLQLMFQKGFRLCVGDLGNSLTVVIRRSHSKKRKAVSRISQMTEIYSAFSSQCLVLACVVTTLGRHDLPHSYDLRVKTHPTQYT